MSVPRRMPPSINTSTCPFTAATISGRALKEAGTPSSCRPPWFDTRNRGNSFIDGTPSVIAGQDAFDDDRAGPQITNPTQVCPRHRGGRERGIDIDKWHRPLAWDDDVRERRQTAVTQETDQPSRMGQYLRKKRDLLQQAPADELFHPVAVVALTESGDGGVDGHDQRGVPRNPSAFDHCFGGTATAHEIQLIEHR